MLTQLSLAFALFAVLLTGVTGRAANTPRAEPFDPSKNPEYHLEGVPPLWVLSKPWVMLPDKNLGFRPPRDTTIRHIVRTLDTVLIDTNMHFDGFSRRVTPQSRMERRTKYLALFGCSFVLGIGVDDDQTLPTRLAERLPDYHLYNLGGAGSGPHQMLARIDEEDFPGSIAESAGMFIYVPIDDHIARANGFYQQGWAANSPHFRKVGGELQRDGTLRSAYPWTYAFYDLVRKIQQRWLPSRAFNFPDVRPRHIQYTCDLIAASRDHLKKRFPGSEFLVVNHPLGRMRKEVMDCLRERGVSVLEPSLPAENYYTIPIEGHPSARFNEDFAAELAKGLDTHR